MPFVIEKHSSLRIAKRVTLETRLNYVEERLQEVNEIVRTIESDAAILRFKCRFYKVLFIALSTSNLAFTYTGLSVVAFKWWVALAAISGVSIVLGLWTHVLLEIKLLGRTIIIAEFTCSFLGILCMAPIRGRAFALQMNSAISGSTSNEQGAAFYTSSLTLFFIFFSACSRWRWSLVPAIPCISG